MYVLGGGNSNPGPKRGQKSDRTSGRNPGEKSAGGRRESFPSATGISVDGELSLCSDAGSDSDPFDMQKLNLLKKLMGH